MNHDKDTDDFWSAISRIEISVKNSQNDIRKLYLHSTRQEIAIESLNEKIDANRQEVRQYQQENRERFDKIENILQENHERFDKIENILQENHERFDKIEDTLVVIVNHLQK
ncbi:hypothetical protein [Endozoicomonas sp. 4G]|uniref:hypothetical protein n=1 Tax=Endozoicomonas sp. 4G TaxID=2872754 RepID=UPI002078EF6E|nr:hypothetical protein [Endozoicomonas sp. 4G]